MASNSIIAGDYAGKSILIEKGKPYIRENIDGKWENLYFNKQYVDSYEFLDSTTQKSAASAVGRAALGAVFLGPVGLLAGVTAKSKGTHTIAIFWKDGKHSLLEVDDKLKKAIITQLF